MNPEVQARIIQKQATQIGNLVYTQTALEAERDVAMEANSELEATIAGLKEELKRAGEDAQRAKDQTAASSPEQVTVQSEVVQED